jgi:hypothetical protein
MICADPAPTGGVDPAPDDSAGALSTGDRWTVGWTAEFGAAISPWTPPTNAVDDGAGVVGISCGDSGPAVTRCNGQEDFGCGTATARGIVDSGTDAVGVATAGRSACATGADTSGVVST